MGLSVFYNGVMMLFSSKAMHSPMYGSPFYSDLMQDSEDIRRSQGNHNINASNFLVVLCKLAERCCGEAERQLA